MNKTLSLGLALILGAACQTAKPITDQPPAQDTQDTSALGPAARQWAATPQPAAMIEFFKGTFETLAITLDTGESFTVKHTGARFEFLPGADEEADFHLALQQANIDHIVEYAQDGEVDPSEATRIMAVLFTPFTQEILNHPVTNDPDLREKSGVEELIHTYLLDPEGNEVASHSMRYAEEKWTVTPGIDGEPKRVFRINAEQAADYQRRAFQAIKTNSPLGWLEFVNWYRKWRETCSTVPGEA